MPRIMIMVVGVLSLLLAACSPPDVALSSGGGDGGADAPAAVTQPPAEEPYLKGPIDSIFAKKPVTTDCVSEADVDWGGTASGNDPPVCDPNPSTYGSINLTGNRVDQGGDTAIEAGVEKTVPIARRGPGGTIEPIEFSDLAKGDVISLWITGPVMESSPLQGQASYILVED